MKSICTTFKSKKIICAKLFLKNEDFTNVLFVAGPPKKWKIRHFGMKQILFAQLLIGNQKSDFMKRTKKISEGSF